MTLVLHDANGGVALSKTFRVSMARMRDFSMASSSTIRITRSRPPTMAAGEVHMYWTVPGGRLGNGRGGPERQCFGVWRDLLVGTDRE